MALNSSGQISMGGSTTGQSINLELGYGATATISLNDTAIRNLAGIGSGAISLSNFWGKASAIISNISISTNTTNYTLNPSVCPGYSAGKTTVNLTVNSGIWLYSTSTGTPALTVSGFTSGDVINIINNGYIAGMGGVCSLDKAGSAGGPAISLSYSTRITNNSYIGGGGGSGAVIGGGGAGGGNGVTNGGGTVGVGGSPGAAGGNGGSYNGTNSGGGGRIFPGTGGASKGLGGGAGGAGGNYLAQTGPNAFAIGSGGGGGGWGASGGAGGKIGYSPYPQQLTAGLGGSAGGIGGNGQASNTAGGAGGKAIALNGYSVTWVTTGTVYGAVS